MNNDITHNGVYQNGGFSVKLILVLPLPICASITCPNKKPVNVSNYFIAETR
jgi:hypothetical protein